MPSGEVSTAAAGHSGFCLGSLRSCLAKSPTFSFACSLQQETQYAGRSELGAIAVAIRTGDRPGAAAVLVVLGAADGLHLTLACRSHRLQRVSHIVRVYGMHRRRQPPST